MQLSKKPEDFFNYQKSGHEHHTRTKTESRFFFLIYREDMTSFDVEEKNDINVTTSDPYHRKLEAEPCARKTDGMHPSTPAS